MGNPELQEQLGRKDPQATLELRVVPALLAPAEYLEHQEQLEIKVQQEISGQWVLKVLLGQLVNPVLKVL